MVISSRWLVVLTVVLTAVFVGSAWWEGGIRTDLLLRELLLVGLNTLPLLAIRRNPLAVVLVLMLAYPTWVALEHPTHELQSLPTLLAMYALGGWNRRLWVRAIGLIAPVWMVGAALYGLWDVDPLGLSYVGLMFIVVWALGVAMAGRRTYATQLEARTEELEQARRELADQAVAEERARIARELHDVIAHAMSVITVQAGVGSHLVDQRPAQAAEALQIIERTGREALDEMRRLLAVLREPDPDGPLPDPQPGLAALPDLIEQTRATGTRFTFSLCGSSRPIGPGLELAVYRVVQEALTNTVKHAPGSNGSVTLTYGPESLDVEVVNGDVARGDVAGDAGDEITPGHGLRGMAERVALYDGELETTASKAGFRVVARFPWEEQG